MNKITTCLWFDNNAKEAVDFYTSIFKNSKITDVSYYGPGEPGPEGSVLTIIFELEGHRLMALNGGPHFTLSPAVSLVIDCETQEEVDFYWDTLSEGGAKEMCGWLRDKYGLSWQIVPTELGELMQSGEPQKVSRMVKAMLQMRKLDIQALKLAYEGK